VSEAVRYVRSKVETVIMGGPWPAAVASEVSRLGVERVFLLASSHLEQAIACSSQLGDALGGRLVGYATGVLPHTSRSQAVEIARSARAANADALVTVGGGSAVDAAKMVQICLEHDVEHTDDLDAFRVVVHDGGEHEIPTFRGPTVPHIAVPTTLSGGEFNHSAGATDPRSHRKESFSHPSLAPVVVVHDPELTLHTPSRLWLSTGVRSLDRAIESLCSLRSNLYGDVTAQQAIRLLRAGLLESSADDSSLDARAKCLLGVQLSQEPKQAGVPMGASRAIGHVIGGLLGVPHGMTSCAVLPSVLRYNRDCNSARQALVSAAMEHDGEAAADVVERFIRQLGLPTSLTELGVTADDHDAIAVACLRDRFLYANPRPIRSAGDVKAILALAA